MIKRKSDRELAEEKSGRVMAAVVKYAAYFRANIHRFVEEYLGIELKLFQKILLYAMDHNDASYYIASRGQGKSFLVALYAVSRCILYPHTQCIVCSYTYKQGRIIMEKITNDFMHRSPLLVAEIARVTLGQNDCFIYFKNGSWIKVVVAGEGARGNRSNLLIVDESRLVPEKTVSEILKPMNASSRYAGYLNKPEYYDLQEVNKQIYMSSAYYSSSEMYEKVKGYFAAMLTPGMKFFVTSLPYQLSIKEGLLLRQAIINEMSEATFSDISFAMEREGLFYGSTEDALFDFKVLDKRRVLPDCLFDLDYYRDTHTKVPEKKRGELRVLSVDVALLASRKHDNDASSIMIHSAIPTNSNDYIDNIVLIDSAEGLLTEELGLTIMRYYYQYDCDYIALDSTGIGQAIADFLMGSNRYDPLYNQEYGALDAVNNPEMSERCKVKGAPKVIYAIKANAKSNNDMCLALRNAFQNGYVNLLINDTNIDEKLSKIRGYSKLSDVQQARMRMPYLQTTLLINELINLTHDTSNGLVRVRERSGMRKDRYSSAMYGLYVIQELSKQLRPKLDCGTLLDQLSIRRGSYLGRMI